ncbi:MAG: type III pantothenate kinase [Marinobacter sp.]|nr:type III pantothenate kinase [Marinobacter sp.]
MRLLIDAGNTRVKWQVVEGERRVLEGVGALDNDPFAGLSAVRGKVSRIAVSTVASEDKRRFLTEALSCYTSVKPCFYWSEAERNGLVNIYEDPGKMGADRWHGMYGAWTRLGGGFAVVDAGSAITIDFVAAHGQHLGGYILPGRRMMLRSLRNDAARIGFEDHRSDAGDPGASTTECVHHGLFWLWQSMAARIHQDCRARAIGRILVTGGDASGVLAAGLGADHLPDLVLHGLAAIDVEESEQP